MLKALKYKDIDLLAAMNNRQKIEQGEKKTASRLPILVIIMVLFMVGGGYYYLHSEVKSLEEEKNTIDLYLKDPATLENYNASLRLQAMADYMIGQKDSLGSVLLNISSYPDLTADDFHTIFEYADVYVKLSEIRYDRNTGVLSFDAESSSVTDVPIFVGQLRRSGIFSDVRYEGYTEIVNENTEETTPRRELRRDEFGNPVFNPLTDEPVYDEIPQTRTNTEKSFLFAVTALVKAPEPRFPSPNDGVNADTNVTADAGADDGTDTTADTDAAADAGTTAGAGETASDVRN